MLVCHNGSSVITFFGCTFVIISRHTYEIAKKSTTLPVKSKHITKLNRGQLSHISPPSLELYLKLLFVTDTTQTLLYFYKNPKMFLNFSPSYGIPVWFWMCCIRVRNSNNLTRLLHANKTLGLIRVVETRDAKAETILANQIGKKKAATGGKTNRDLKWPSRAQCSYWVCRAAECYLWQHCMNCRLELSRAPAGPALCRAAPC